MKEYVKPELFFESFELSEQIATCDFDSNNTNTEVKICTFTGENDYGVNHGTYFTDSNTRCTTKLEEYCYHASTSSLVNLFNS